MEKERVVVEINTHGINKRKSEKKKYSNCSKGLKGKTRGWQVK
jgi:hypothetical protein